MKRSGTLPPYRSSSRVRRLAAIRMRLTPRIAFETRFVPISLACLMIACLVALCDPFTEVMAHASSLSSSQSLYVTAAEVVAIPSKNGNTAQIVETLEIHNGTGTATSFVAPVPSGATNAQLIEAQSKGWTYSKGVFSNVALPAGDSTLVLSMQAALGGQSADLTFTQPYTIQELFVVVPQGALFVSAEGGFLTSSDTFVTGNVTYRRFTKYDLQDNTPWTFSLTLLPTAGGRQVSISPSLTVLNAYSSHSADLEAAGNLLLAAAILVVGMISIRRSGILRPEQDRYSKKRLAALLAKRELLMREWTDLEIAQREVDQEMPQEGLRGLQQYQTRQAEYLANAVAIDVELHALQHR